MPETYLLDKNQVVQQRCYIRSLYSMIVGFTEHEIRATTT
jgi:hypothetical protein